MEAKDFNGEVIAKDILKLLIELRDNAFKEKSMEKGHWLDGIIGSIEQKYNITT